ncbi:MAG TPA: hypothetical protein VGG75_22440 [Trebonia sp.]|jgi:hypothetical protein
MLGLAATAAAHGSIQSSETVAVIVVIIAALFWKFLVKVGIAIIAIGFLFVIGTVLYMIVTGLQALVR